MHYANTQRIVLLKKKVEKLKPETYCFYFGLWVTPKEVGVGGREQRMEEVAERIRKSGLGFCCCLFFFRPVKMLLGETEIKMIKE